MAISIAFSLRRMLAAVTLFSLPFFLLPDDFLLLKIVVGSYLACLGVQGNLSHIVPVLKLFVCAAACQLPSLGLVINGHFSPAEIISHFVLGALPGLALGIAWVQYPHDVRLFEAFIENPHAFSKKVGEPSLLRTSLLALVVSLVLSLALYFLLCFVTGTSSSLF